MNLKWKQSRSNLYYKFLHFISCHRSKKKSFIWAYEPSKKIVKRISFNDLTLLHDVDLKRSLLIWKLFLLCISHLKNENTSCRIFCLLAKWNKVRLNLFDKYWNRKIHIFSPNSICFLQCSSTTAINSHSHT